MHSPSLLGLGWGVWQTALAAMLSGNGYSSLAKHLAAQVRFGGASARLAMGSEGLLPAPALGERGHRSLTARISAGASRRWRGIEEARVRDSAEVIDAVPEPVSLPAPSRKPRRKCGAEANACPGLPDEQGESE
jgi:hypothetical protein